MNFIIRNKESLRVLLNEIEFNLPEDEFQEIKTIDQLFDLIDQRPDSKIVMEKLVKYLISKELHHVYIKNEFQKIDKVPVDFIFFNSILKQIN